MLYRCPVCGALYQPVVVVTVPLPDGTMRTIENNHDGSYRHAMSECPQRQAQPASAEGRGEH